jgi:hypothetical protein
MLVSALLLMILFALALWSPYSQQLNDAKLYNYIYMYDFPKIGACNNVGMAWRFLETLPEGTRIAPIGGAVWQYYPIFGRRLLHIPVFINKSYLHKYWRQGTFWDSWDKDKGHELSPHKEEYLKALPLFIPKLIAAKVDYVVAGKVDEEVWPPEQELLAVSPYARVVYKAQCLIIWEIISTKN